MKHMKHMKPNSPIFSKRRKVNPAMAGLSDAMKSLPTTETPVKVHGSKVAKPPKGNKWKQSMDRL